MPKVVFDYKLCVGSGECAKDCPVEILEVSKKGKWCKPKDDKVENKKAIAEFHKKVEPKEHGKANLKIEFEIPECIECRVCETSCPKGAVTIE